MVISNDKKSMLFGAETPFILLARIQVKPDKVQEYLLLAAKTDKAVEDSEPGMLHHTFDQDRESSLFRLVRSLQK